MNKKPRGVLDLRAGEQWFDVSLCPPTPELAGLIEHYWTVRWDLRGQEPYPQHTLPHPSVHLVAEHDRSRIYGVPTGRFTRLLQGRGRVFGIKFRPAGFRPFLGSAVSALTNRTVAVSQVFGTDGDALVARLLSLGQERSMVEVAEAFIRSRRPAADPSVVVVNQVVGEIMAEREITRVDDVVSRTGIGKRTLQRLFTEYVGVSPKWVIQRYRLHEAAERLAGGEDLDLAVLALDLGYFDQAHFARDFKAIVGRPPAQYARSASRSA